MILRAKTTILWKSATTARDSYNLSIVMSTLAQIMNPHLRKRLRVVAIVLHRDALSRKLLDFQMHRKLKAPPAGLEPAIFGLEVRRLVH